MGYRWKIAQFFEAWWWRCYRRGTSDDAYLSWKTNYWHRLLHRMDAWPLPGEQVLDAGCGPAGVFIALPEASVTALDPLLDRYRRTWAYLRTDRFPNVRFESSPLEQWVPAFRYDRLYCLNAINHVADLPLSLHKLNSALIPGATAYFTVDAHRYRWLEILFRLLPGDILHPHQLSLSAYCALFDALGFEVAAVKRLDRTYVFDYFWIEMKKKKKNPSSAV
ncbi:MAG: hypothetical protein RLY31_592 [Bacteroidota bacterium]|jgi:2-polyprenyl-6-hydroxyphenyl methylase/3-demethylubiquinone-9 3-methyltransferase